MVRERIVIVEDDVSLAHMLKLTLEKEGYIVNIFHTAEEALPHLQKNPPEVLLLDIMLPGMSGLELLKLLKEAAETAKIPVIMVTAKKELSDVQTALTLGAEGYLVKPFDKKKLLQKIEELIPQYYVDENVLAEAMQILSKPVEGDVEKLRVLLAEINSAMRLLRKGAAPEKLKPQIQKVLSSLEKKKSEVIEKFSEE